jgi:purine-binding chemotaxis protein CheW
VDAVAVRLGDARYAIPMADLAEVGRAPLTSRVPGTPRWVAGVGNWRGRVLAVLDGRALLDPTAYAAPPGDRLVVLAKDGVTVGLLVDRLDGTTPLPEAVEPAPPGAADLVVGTVIDDEGPLGLRDVGAIIGLRHRLAA